jgi:hypothetical protein
LVTADYNAEMIEHIARYPRVRDRAVFVGNPDDIVPDASGPQLPLIGDWTRPHFCVVTVGGSGVGGHLLRRVIEAFPEAKRQVPALRMVMVAGPRIDPASLPTHDGLEVRAFVPRLYRHLAACDLAVVQGGLTTCMEFAATGGRSCTSRCATISSRPSTSPTAWTATGRAGGWTMPRATLTPSPPPSPPTSAPGRLPPVETDGAARAASLIAELL